MQNGSLGMWFFVENIEFIMTTIFTEEFCNLYSLTIDCGKGARLYSRWIQRNHPYPKESPISVAPVLEMSVWRPSRIIITQLNSTLTGLSFIKAIFAVFSPQKKHQQENDLQRALANLGGTVSHTNAKHCNITVQLAWENSPHLATLPLVCPPNDVWETRAEIPYWWRVTTQIWVVLLIGRAPWEIWFSQSEALPKSV